MALNDTYLGNVNSSICREITFYLISQKILISYKRPKNLMIKANSYQEPTVCACQTYKVLPIMLRLSITIQASNSDHNLPFFQLSS